MFGNYFVYYNNTTKSSHYINTTMEDVTKFVTCKYLDLCDDICNILLILQNKSMGKHGYYLTDFRYDLPFRIHTLAFDSRIHKFEITDTHLQALSGIHTLFLNNYLTPVENITDDGLKYLTSIHTLHIDQENFITDNGLRHLTNIHTLDLMMNWVCN